MTTVYPKPNASVKERRHDLPDPETLVNDLRLHPALARRKDVSKGSREAFAWIEALHVVYKRDDPTTPWLALAMGDGPRQVARSLAELEDLGIIRVLSDGHNRRIRIAESMSPAKGMGGNRDRNVKDADGNCDRNVTENVIEADANHDRKGMVEGGNDDENGRVHSGNHDENGRDSCARVGFSESKKESKSQDSETRSSETRRQSFRQSLSDEKRKKAQTTCEMFGAHPKNGSVREYEGQLLKCIEAGREECFDLAVLQARIAQDGSTLQTPVAYIRRVITTHLEEDDKNKTLALLEQAQYDYETPAQRRQTDMWERELVADGAARMAPPARAVADLMGGVAKGMPQYAPNKAENNFTWTPAFAEPLPAPTEAELEAERRLGAMLNFDAQSVRLVAAQFAHQGDPATARLSSSNPARKALVRRHLIDALAQWDTKQARKPSIMSREETREWCKAETNK